jgi:hypothetical protein
MPLAGAAAPTETGLIPKIIAVATTVIATLVLVLVIQLILQ